MSNLMIRYGLIAGAVVSVLMFAPYFVFGAKPEQMKLGEIVGYTSMVLAMSATFLAMRRERERRGGALGFGAAFGIGVGVSAIAGLLFGIATLGFYAIVGDALPDAMVEFYTQQANAAGSPEAVAAKLAELERMRPLLYSHSFSAALMFATVFLIGLVESAIGALMLKKGV